METPTAIAPAIASESIEESSVAVSVNLPDKPASPLFTVIWLLFPILEWIFVVMLLRVPTPAPASASAVPLAEPAPEADPARASASILAVESESSVIGPADVTTELSI